MGGHYPIQYRHQGAASLAHTHLWGEPLLLRKWVGCSRGFPSWPSRALCPNWELLPVLGVCTAGGPGIDRRGAPSAREKVWPQAGCCRGREGTTSWGSRCWGPRRVIVQSRHRVEGRGPRVLPGWKPQAPLAVAMDGSGNEQPDCMEQGQTPVGGTPRLGQGSTLTNVHRWS